jgi:ElaB/YqjD/DUF883 family membrane-anchored ribosome-binding protein
MMDQAMSELDRARARMASDLGTVITDGEDLLKAVATVSEEGVTLARTRFAEKLGRARKALAAASQPVLDRTRGAAAAADGYVRGNPWIAVGVAIAAGVLIGLLAATRESADAGDDCGG